MPYNLFPLTSHKKQTRAQNLEGNNSLSLEAASEQDNHSSGGDGCSNLGGVSDGGGSLLQDNILGGVIFALGSLNLLC